MVGFLLYLVVVRNHYVWISNRQLRVFSRYLSLLNNRANKNMGWPCRHRIQQLLLLSFLLYFFKFILKLVYLHCRSGTFIFVVFWSFLVLFPRFDKAFLCFSTFILVFSVNFMSEVQVFANVCVCRIRSWRFERHMERLDFGLVFF